MRKKPTQSRPPGFAVHPRGTRRCYRIVEVAHDSRRKEKVFKTLFHGINGSRVLERGQWIKAVKRPVSDGGTVYTAGFHVLEDRDDCQVYLDRFTRPRDLRIIPVLARGLRPKAHSPYPVLLADWMQIEESTTPHQESEQVLLNT